MPQGAVVKCHAVYDEPFWRAQGLTGQAGSDAGPAKVIFDNSPPDGSPGVLLAFLEGGLARELGTWPAEQRRAAVIGTLTRLSARGPPRPSVHEQSWADEEWTRGCYGSYLPPGAWTAFGKALRPPIGRAALGRRRVRASAGAATWTALSAPARPRRRRFVEPPRGGTG